MAGAGGHDAAPRPYLMRLLSKDADQRTAALLRLPQGGGAGTGGAGELSDPVRPRLGLQKPTWTNDTVRTGKPVRSILEQDGYSVFVVQLTSFDAEVVATRIVLDRSGRCVLVGHRRPTNKGIDRFAA
jgi:hypothetical protein